MKGQKHSDEAKAKMRARVRTPEHNAKISASRKGHATHCMPHTDVGRANIAAAMIGKTHSDETKAKLRAAAIERNAR